MISLAESSLEKTTEARTIVSQAAFSGKPLFQDRLGNDVKALVVPSMIVSASSVATTAMRSTLAWSCLADSPSPT